ncbi:MAG: alpha/beta fold hydrolase [Pseudomonadota bacterium]
MQIAGWRTGLWCLLPVLFAGCVSQDDLVYHPRTYVFAQSEIPVPARPISFATSQGAEQSFFVPPRSGQLASLWIFFPGNGSMALDWLHWVNQYPDASTGFLLIDYPGYGFSEGRPSAKAILETSEKAFLTLAQSLGTDPGLLWRKTSVLGHSLGAATALQFAAKYTPQRVVLVSPFTNLRAIGKSVLGAWVGPLVTNEYDNLVRIKELENRNVPVYVIHGSADDIIPVEMGRELGRMFSWVDYQEVRGASHNDMFDLGRAAILRSMRQQHPRS